MAKGLIRIGLIGLALLAILCAAFYYPGYLTGHDDNAEEPANDTRETAVSQDSQNENKNNDNSMVSVLFLNGTLTAMPQDHVPEGYKKNETSKNWEEPAVTVKTEVVPPANETKEAETETNATEEKVDEVEESANETETTETNATEPAVVESKISKADEAEAKNASHKMNGILAKTQSWPRETIKSLSYPSYVKTEDDGRVFYLVDKDSSSDLKFIMKDTPFKEFFGAAVTEDKNVKGENLWPNLGRLTSKALKYRFVHPDPKENLEIELIVATEEDETLGAYRIKKGDDNLDDKLVWGVDIVPATEDEYSSQTGERIRPEPPTEGALTEREGFGDNTDQSTEREGF